MLPGVTSLYPVKVLKASVACTAIGCNIVDLTNFEAMSKTL